MLLIVALNLKILLLETVLISVLKAIGETWQTTHVLHSVFLANTDIREQIKELVILLRLCLGLLEHSLEILYQSNMFPNAQ